MEQDPDMFFAITDDVIKNCSSVNMKPEDWLPTSANLGDAGLDCRSSSVEDIVLQPGCQVKIPLGFEVFIPTGYWLEIRPRSSTFISRSIDSLYGVIDQDFAMPVMFIGRYQPDNSKLLNDQTKNVIKFGERVAQAILHKKYASNNSIISKEEMLAKRVSRPTTRSGGFGSSGKF